MNVLHQKPQMLFMTENSTVIEMLSSFIKVLSSWNFSVLASKRYLKIKTFEEKCKTLKDLEHFQNKKDVLEKYDVLHNTASTWLI